MSSKFLEKPVFAFILAFIGVVLFSSKAVIVKLAYEFNIDALSLLSLRLLFALPVYIVVLLTSFRERFRRIREPASNYFKIVVLGILGYYLASYLDFAGLTYITASLERLILFVYPTIVLILSAIFLGEKATREQKLAVGITYFGVILALLQNRVSTAENIALGSGLVFLSAVTYAIYLIGSGKLIPIFGTKLFTSIAMSVSTVAALVHYVAVNRFELLGFENEVYLLAIAMAVISTVIPSFLISEAIRVMGASNVAIVGSFGPISTIILASIFLEERITFMQMLGTLIVIGGILLLAVKKNKPKLDQR